VRKFADKAACQVLGEQYEEKLDPALFGF